MVNIAPWRGTLYLASMTSLYTALIKPVQCGALFSVYCRGYTFSRCVHIPKGIYEPVTALHCIAHPSLSSHIRRLLGRKKEELKSVKLREPCGELKPRCPERSSPHMVLTAATANQVPSFKHPRVLELGKATTASSSHPLTRLTTPLHYGHACPGIGSIRSCNAEGVLSRLAVSVWRVWLRGVKSLIEQGVISQLKTQLRDYEDSRGKTHTMYELNYAATMTRTTPQAS